MGTAAGVGTARCVRRVRPRAVPAQRRRDGGPSGFYSRAEKEVQVVTTTAAAVPSVQEIVLSAATATQPVRNAPRSTSGCAPSAFRARGAGERPTFLLFC